MSHQQHYQFLEKQCRAIQERRNHPTKYQYPCIFCELKKKKNKQGKVEEVGSDVAEVLYTSDQLHQHMSSDRTHGGLVLPNFDNISDLNIFSTAVKKCVVGEDSSKWKCPNCHVEMSRGDKGEAEVLEEHWGQSKQKEIAEEGKQSESGGAGKNKKKESSGGSCHCWPARLLPRLLQEEHCWIGRDEVNDNNLSSHPQENKKTIIVFEQEEVDDHDNEDDEEGEWDEDDEFMNDMEMPFPCLYCDPHLSSPTSSTPSAISATAAFQHLAAVHHFSQEDFISTLWQIAITTAAADTTTQKKDEKEEGLPSHNALVAEKEMYTKIKVINFIRIAMQEMQCPHCRSVQLLEEGHQDSHPKKEVVFTGFTSHEELLSHIYAQQHYMPDPNALARFFLEKERVAEGEKYLVPVKNNDGFISYVMSLNRRKMGGKEEQEKEDALKKNENRGNKKKESDADLDDDEPDYPMVQTMLELAAKQRDQVPAEFLQYDEEVD